ncbi:hypothetical protein AB1I63_09475 [Streptococcus pneumoniae]
MKKQRILSMFALTSVAILLTACGGEKKEAGQASSSSVKIEKKASKSETKKNSSTKSSKDSEMKATETSSSTMENVTSGVSGESENKETSAPSTNKENEEENKVDAYVPNGGTLSLYEETPVYTDMDKGEDAGFTLPAGDIEWDQYLEGNGDYWYSYESNGTRYYIAYSDVGH